VPVRRGGEPRPIPIDIGPTAVHYKIGSDPYADGYGPAFHGHGDRSRATVRWAGASTTPKRGKRGKRRNRRSREHPPLESPHGASMTGAPLRRSGTLSQTYFLRLKIPVILSQ